MSELWEKALILANATLKDAMEAINGVPFHAVLVVDNERRLLGTVTDGDIRRSLLAGHLLNDQVSAIMNKKPVYVSEGTPPEQIVALLKGKSILQVPILDSEMKVMGLEYLEGLLTKKIHPNTVFLMAGGKGTRLKNLTMQTPKPLLKIGEKPILENILNSFLSQGFRKFVISLGYLGDKIRSYFGDGTKWGCEIDYTYETKPLGTAGALSLIKETPQDPIIVMNGDILTQVDFSSLLHFHKQEKACGTMCVREEEFTFPYGVVEITKTEISSISEKPQLKHFVNSGIYVLNPECFPLIPKDRFFNMTSLFSELVNHKLKAMPYILHEYWIDIGRPEEFNRAIKDFTQD